MFICRSAKDLKCKIFYLLIIGIFLFFSVVNITAEDGDTVVSVSPLNQTVSAGETFDVDIICSPSQPIKAFEFRLSFDSSILEANSVTEGGFFDGYSTFFNSGTIDNDGGSIFDIYGLIIGPGNVTDNGSLITISFTAKQNSGTSSLSLNGVGVTDEYGYLSIGVFDGSVTVEGGNNGGGGDFPPIGDEENNPPNQPVKPTGPTFVETGVEYEFETSSFDVDGDWIRFRFDWGDGNFSNWSDYVDSNVSVSMSHSWSYVSTFEVKAIAQDEFGLNSSWSIPLNVTVSQVGFGGNPPVANINFSGNFTENETIVFDASGSFDIDGYIVTYFWDFGDGEFGSGEISSHIYNTSGDYTVTLVVTDNDGNSYSKSVVISVFSFIEENLDDSQGIFVFDFGLLIFGILILVILCLVFVYRDKIQSFLSSYQFDISLRFNFLNLGDRIRKIDEKIVALKNEIGVKADFKQPFVARQEAFSEEFLSSHDKINRFIDSEVAVASSDDAVGRYDRFDTGDKVDNLVGLGFEPKSEHVSRFVEDFDSSVDDIIFSDIGKQIDRIDEDEYLSSKSDEDSVERKIDDVIDMKVRVKIDSLFEDS